MAHTAAASRIAMRRAFIQSTKRFATPSQWQQPPAAAARLAYPRRVILFSTSAPSRQAASAEAAAEATPAEGAAEPAAAEGASEAGTTKSSCPAGTVLSGLNYFKGKSDPVARKDEDYPAWLWNCLEVTQKAKVSDDADAGDEFSKSKKQRKIALKRRRELEAKAAASGDMALLARKIPLEHQTINLPGGEGGPDDVVSTMHAAEKRTELRVAMRKERRAKIKESNYLRSM